MSKKVTSFEIILALASIILIMSVPTYLAWHDFQALTAQCVELERTNGKSDPTYCGSVRPGQGIGLFWLVSITISSAIAGVMYWKIREVL